ncbi:MAG: hypothetical protein KF752_03415 [Pirellulaceae bacterium]|nr:hypothetical protein [Pirellulaceae bacterium]
MVTLHDPLACRIAEATQAVFGSGALTLRVRQACSQYERDLENIRAGRGIRALLIAIVGAKGQGKTWIARQLVHSPSVRQHLRSGDLQSDATTRLAWIGPVPPDGLDASWETYHACPASEMVELGQSYVLLDTPGVTDSDQAAAKLAHEALSLAPVKLLAIARDQIRAAANIELARQIDGSICLPMITSVEPAEMQDASLASDLRNLRDQLTLLAPHTQLLDDLLIPDFEITGDEAAAGDALRAGLLDRWSSLGLNPTRLSNASEIRQQTAARRLKSEVAKVISQELPQLAEAVSQLHREAEQLPARVMASLLGSQSVLETGIRIRLRTRLVNDTSLMWFPYRTVLSVLNLTHGAWDRIVLALTGSVPSLFGALTSWARNVRQGREFSAEVNDGIRQRTQQQVQERLQPLCDQFRRTVMKLRPREQRSEQMTATGSQMSLLGIEELQTRSREIFEQALQRNSTASWRVQLYALAGMVLFWLLMAAPIVVLYREYLATTVSVWTGREHSLESFPSPHPGMFLTSLVLSLLPLMIYCMCVLTLTLNSRRISRVASQVAAEHEQTINQLQESQIIRIQFNDELLEQAEYLLTLA